MHIYFGGFIRNFYILLVFTCVWGQGSSSLCDIGYIEIDHNCYFQLDIDILNFLISDSPDINLILDNNNNGSIEPLELCSQSWINGHLIVLDCGPIIINGNYNWLEIAGNIPAEIGSLESIEVLNLSYNNLSGNVPEQICNLNLDFSDSEIFSLQGNDLCPPYPECIEDFMGTQSNFGSGSCEISNCYDVGVVQMTMIEVNGDNLINPYDDIEGSPQLLITIHNDGPPCSAYPGLMVTADYPGTSFEEEEGNPAVNWWYAIFADDSYYSNFTFEISPYIPIGSDITLTAKVVTMGCMDETCSEDPYCHDCPNSEPASITFTIGELFPSQLGDANVDGGIDILDVVLVVSFILDGLVNQYYDEYNGIELYLSDINQDNNINVLDIVTLVELILNP
tara:strand:+ start:315 stop:1496 length:1182 start_codon:yes stop_codon:yes gene_type:complete